MSHPDSQIFPHATGAAQDTVNQHTKPEELIFHAGWFCPFVQRTWISLEEKGIPYQYNEVNPYKKEKEFLAKNPKGLVPAMEYKGQALYESLILCEFLEDAYPTYTPLLPADPFQRGRARVWIDHISKSVLPANMRLTQAQTKEAQDQAREDLYKALRAFTEQIQGPYFLGEDFSMVDIAIVPWIVRDHINTEHRGYSRAEVGEKWAKYAELVSQRPTVLKTTSERKHYLPMSKKYLKDEAQSEAAKAIRAGRAIP